MRIAVVAGHFVPELGYQEVYLARAFARVGHEVVVITSDRASPSGRKALGLHDYAAGRFTDPRYGFSVIRLHAVLHIGATVFARKLIREVEIFRPDVVVAIGPGKVFPLPLFKKNRNYRLVVVFGDNADYWNFSSVSLTVRSVRMRISQRVLKDVVYTRAVKHADRILLTTNETERVIAKRLPPGLRTLFQRKQILLPLGYDPDDFFFSAEERREGRDELRFAESDCVFVTCTRVAPEKSLERVVDQVTNLRREGHSVRYVIAGFLEDAYSKTLREYIRSQPDPEIFECLPFLDHGAARRLYCSADIGVWLRAAISIQESMGTGLPVILEDKPSVQHLVRESSNGWLFLGNALDAAMKDAVGESRRWTREEVAAKNYERLSYDVIARRLIDMASS